jgi:hypothetical protein
VTPILISPSEGWDLQQLLSIKLKQPLDECELQNFRRDEGDMNRGGDASKRAILRAKDIDMFAKPTPKKTRALKKSPIPLRAYVSSCEQGRAQCDHFSLPELK